MRCTTFTAKKGLPFRNFNLVLSFNYPLLKEKYIETITCTKSKSNKYYLISAYYVIGKDLEIPFKKEKPIQAKQINFYPFNGIFILLLRRGNLCLALSIWLSGLPLWLSWQRIYPQCGKPGFDPWIGKNPWRWERLPTLVFWPGEFHGLYSHGVTNSQTKLNDFHYIAIQCFPPGSVVKNPPAIAGDAALIPESGRSLREGIGNLLKYSCLGNFMHRETWRATVHGVTKESDTTL